MGLKFLPVLYGHNRHVSTHPVTLYSSVLHSLNPTLHTTDRRIRWQTWHTSDDEKLVWGLLFYIYWWPFRSNKTNRDRWQLMLRGQSGLKESKRNKKRKYKKKKVWYVLTEAKYSIAQFSALFQICNDTGDPSIVPMALCKTPFKSCVAVSHENVNVWMAARHGYIHNIRTGKSKLQMMVLYYTAIRRWSSPWKFDNFDVRTFISNFCLGIK